MKRRIVASIMSVFMLVGLLPLSAYALEDGEDRTSKTQTTKNEDDLTDGSVMRAGGPVTVEMNDILVKTNQAVRMSYTVTEGYEDLITFAVADPQNEGKVSFNDNDGDHIWSINPVQNKNKAGDIMTIQALYENEVVGSCDVYFVPYIGSYNTGVEYTLEAGGAGIATESVKIPFAEPTALYAFWEDSALEGSDVEELQNATVSKWDWSVDKPEVVGVEEDPANSAKVTLTLYQETETARVCAKPWLRIGGRDYLYNYPTSRSDDMGIRADSSKSPLTCDPSNIYEGTTIQVTFDTGKIAGADENTPINWSCSNPDIVPIENETARSVTVTTQKGYISGENVGLTISASVEVGGKLYSAAFSSLWVWRAPTKADATVDTLEALQGAIEDGDKTIAVEQTIDLPKDTALDLTGIHIVRSAGFDGALFQTKEDNVIIEGGDTGTVDGDLRSANEALVTVGENGNLTLRNLTLKNSINSAGEGGAVYAEKGKLTCTDVTFESNKARGTDKSNYYHGGGAIFTMDTELEVTSCTFTGNTAVLGNGGAIYADQGTTGIIQNNTITGSEADGYADDGSGAGGAIYCRLVGAMQILSNHISDCTAGDNGGGIGIVADPTGETGGVRTDVTFDGNTITSCTADNRGGGMYLINSLSTQDTSGQNRDTNCIKLLSGTISECSADWGGGIDYSGHGMSPLFLTNVLITGNTAIRGGGVWACPTSETQTYCTLGGAIYGNHAQGELTTGNRLYASGDEIRYEGLDADVHREDVLILQRQPSWSSESSVMTVLKRALGGGLMQWYADGQDDRYSSGDELADASLYTETQKSFSLHGELSTEYQALAQRSAKFVISNNTAESRGGGIATNSEIVIGLENHDKTVDVTKVWSGNTDHPDAVNVTLVQADAGGNRVNLDTATLSEDNQWTVSFEALPSEYVDESGVTQKYTYTVEEEEMENWTASITSSETGNTITLTLTNTFEEEQTSKPDTESKPGATDQDSNPKTGDVSPIELWCVLAVCSLLGLCVLVMRQQIVRRKNRYQ